MFGQEKDYGFTDITELFKDSRENKTCQQIDPVCLRDTGNIKNCHQSHLSLTLFKILSSLKRLSALVLLPYSA